MVKPMGCGDFGFAATSFIALKRCRFPMYPLGHMVSETSSIVTRGPRWATDVAMARCPALLSTAVALHASTRLATEAITGWGRPDAASGTLQFRCSLDI